MEYSINPWVISSLPLNFNWLNDEIIQKVIHQLDNNPWRFVGGCVRDSLLNKITYDIDINTPLLPQEILSLFKNFNTNTIGIDHGTIMIFLPPFKIEITTLRRDITTDGRKAIVAFTHDWYEDSCRRDFTINSLMLDYKNNKIYDYHGGIEDLIHNKVKFIGKLEERIQEDYLRILRYIRFSIRFNDNYHHSLDVIKPFIMGLNKVSIERMFNEITLILQQDRWIMAINALKFLEIDILLNLNFYNPKDLIVNNIYHRWAIVLMINHNKWDKIPINHHLKQYLNINYINEDIWDKNTLYKNFNKILDWDLLKLINSLKGIPTDYLEKLQQFIQDEGINHKYNKEKIQVINNFTKENITIELKNILWDLWIKYKN